MFFGEDVLPQIMWWLCATILLLGTPLSLILIYRLKYWRTVVSIFLDLVRQPPPLLLFVSLWWVLLPMVVNKAVRNQIASQQAALKLRCRKKILSPERERKQDVNHIVGQLLRSYPHDKLELLKMGAVDLG